MATSLYAALIILRDWFAERRSVGFSFIGKGISVSYSRGAILEVSENEFTFGSKHVTATVDLGVLSNADFVLLDEAESAPPAELTEFLEGDECCALLFGGPAGELAAVLK
jgi:hypothetical protein